ncbi:MAG: CDP-diacylglycerol--serine O-phosphatidyltransferase [Nitrospirae bacterium]|nr:CDP-diacylglycerol--serine O-phosphatidyltransferase [Nitrospirota bacterium]
MKKGIYVFPNALTLCGMFAGFYAIVSAIKASYIHAGWAIIIAMVFDGLDGWVARRTHSTTRFGIELDSLSDVIAFGVAPSLLIYRWALIPFGRIGWAAAFLFVACGALRLARYNVQMGSAERKSFTGMPIPGAAVVIATTVLFYREMGWSPQKNILFLLLVVALSILMVSTLRFHSIKEIDISKRKPFWILVAFIVVLALVLMHTEIALFTASMLYLLTGIFENAYLYLKRQKQPST